VVNLLGPERRSCVPPTAIAIPPPKVVVPPPGNAVPPTAPSQTPLGAYSTPADLIAGFRIAGFKGPTCYFSTSQGKKKGRERKGK